jgi:hypothetical protein
MHACYDPVVVARCVIWLWEYVLLGVPSIYICNTFIVCEIRNFLGLVYTYMSMHVRRKKRERERKNQWIIVQLAC